MSSPDGLPFSQADFLARWMPSSSRAGVILGPPGGDGDLRERRGVTVKLEQVRVTWGHVSIITPESSSGCPPPTHR